MQNQTLGVVNTKSQEVKPNNDINKKNQGNSSILDSQIQIICKKKPPVINVDSEKSGEQIKNVEQEKSKNSKSSPLKTKKIKKTNYKCHVCKQQCKKGKMKICNSCGISFHIDCLGLDEEQIPKKYICQKCKFDKSQIERTNKKIKKVDSKQLQLEKMTFKKVQKEKKKQQYHHKLSQFFQRYPYYSQQGKVRFPIEDKLIFIYRELFDINQSNRLYPIEHPIVPSNILGDLLQIQNFFSTFQQQIEEQDLLDTRKSVLFYNMNCQGRDETFKIIMGCLLKIYLKDVLERNKTDNVKVLNQNIFFTLLVTLNENQQLNTPFLAKISCEIIRFLSCVPSMKKAFENFKFPEEFTLETKTQLLVQLLYGLSQVDEFHELVSKRSDKIQQMTKQRGDLITKLKKDEAQALSNKQKMKEFVLPQTKNNDEAAEKLQKNVKEFQKNKKKLQKLQSQKIKSQSVIKDFKSKISYISKSLFFTTTEIQFLGIDRNKSEYFFYQREPQRLYVKFREYLLSQNSDYFIFDGKQRIQQFVKTLCTKGLQQKRLYENLVALIKEGIIKNDSDYVDMLQPPIQTQQYGHFAITIKMVIEEICQFEEKFTVYLVIRNCQWSHEQIRKDFLQKLKSTDDLQDIKQMLKTLQEQFLFVQPLQERQNQQYSDDQDDERKFVYEHKRKIPIRIWGINAEKIRKYWLQYLQQCVDITGIWICVYIFKGYVDRYVKRKIQYHNQQQKKKQQIVKQQQKQQKKKKLNFRTQRQRSRQQKYNNRKYDVSSQSRSMNVDSLPYLRKSTRINTKKMNIDSDIEPEEQQEEQDSSNNEQVCEICGEYGDMICCDTCPKVFHLDCLKIKQIPEGVWSCYMCLQRMSNERQTRSRVKKIGK